jgi:alanine racemase
VSRLIRAVIDTHALRSNLSTIRRHAPGSRVMAVIKANAYGHGLVPAAQALDDADAFAVARLEEAITLRDAGVNRPITLLEGICDREELAEAARHRLDLVIHHVGQIELLQSYTGPYGFTVWLKADTGMNRLGFRTDEFAAARTRLESLGSVRELRTMTHLARADELDSSMTREQLLRFQALTHGSSGATSIGNSACIFGWPDARSDWIRPGIALYGVSPFANRRGADLGLIPVMTLETRIIALRSVKRGESVGYGGTWRAARDSIIAIAAAGYGDGIRRGLPSGAPVLIEGRRAPLVGRVSMDMLAIDVTDIGPIEPAARVVLWGPEIPVEELAEHAGTIAYELLCGVSHRVAYESR